MCKVYALNCAHRKLNYKIYFKILNFFANFFLNFLKKFSLALENLVICLDTNQTDM